MSTQDTYSIISGCTLRSIGDLYLLTIYPASKPPFALEVNESFAQLFTAVQKMGAFTENDLISLLETDFGLEQDKAADEATRTLSLWKKYELISGK